METPFLRRLAEARVAVAITLISLGAHLWQLGLRPLAHDEALDAWFSWQAGRGDVMKYDPVYHGPFRFYLEGSVLHLFGGGAEWARLVAALAGVAATAIIACSVRTLGRVGAPVAALVFVCSPTVLTVTRTGREDSLIALLSLGLLLLIAHALTRPRPAHLVACGVLLALSWGTKESTFLFGFVASWFFVAAAVIAWRVDGRCRAAVQRIAALGRQPWIWTITAFLVVFMVVFTSGFRYPDGLRSGLVDGVRYWWGQQPVGRGGQPWYFYLVVYGAYEWLLLGLAAVGLVVTLRRRSVIGAWFAVMWLGQIAVYGWAAEKFAWLAVHPLVPAVLLAGMGAQAIWDRVRRPAARPLVARVLAGAFAGLLVLTAVVAVRPAITDGADPRELLVTVQTSDDVPPISQLLHDAQADGTVSSILIDDRGGGSWPWAWYLHDLDGVAYQTLETGSALPEGYDAMIIDSTDGPPQAPDGYVVQRFSLRRWWVPDYSNASLGDLLTWFFTRETWNDTGSYDQYLVIRAAAEP